MPTYLYGGWTRIENIALKRKGAKTQRRREVDAGIETTALKREDEANYEWTQIDTN
jgi:hypothetical protein